MKKFTFVLMLMLAYAGFTMAQTIEDFESIKMNVFSAGDAGAISVVPNPDATGANTSAYVAKFVRGRGDDWAGFYTTLGTAVDLAAVKYIHMKVYKPHLSNIKFKFEGPDIEKEPMAAQTLVNAWEEIVFDFTAGTLVYTKMTCTPDWVNPVDPITMYFDEIYANNDPTVGSTPVQMIENFEIIPINPMLGGVDDLSTFVLAANPDKTGVDISDYVLKFNRDMDGVVWGGFWSNVAGFSSAVDVTTNKYIHAKVWKSRISPVFFKLEGGPGGSLEIESMSPQTKIGAWEDMVWDFSAITAGAYPIIAFMPDKIDPVALTEDMTIYLDDIILNNDPNPTTPPEQIFQVDMNGSGILPTDSLFITGSLGGIYGTWNEPGTNPNNKLTDPDGDGYYTIALSLPNQVIEFKFVKNATWANQDPYGSNRVFTITGDCNVIFTWGVGGFETSIRDNKLAGKIQMYPNPVRNELTVNTTSNISKVIITNTLGKVVGNTIYSRTINTSNLSKGMYFVTFVNADGTKVTQKLIKD
ncbi:MAG: T9SS type A sorting domain-containing protein [Bacteroidales bacterium]|nr:T9SS type A sorting domain-containing protein [Bacteroidales bacterium]